MQSVPEKTNRTIVSLIEGEHDNVRVERLEGDRFFLTTQQAIDALSMASKAVRFQTQFGDLLGLLYEWVDQRKERISAAYISISREGITLLIVQRDVEADFALGDEMVELDIEVVNRGEFELVPFNTLLVPKVGDDVLKSFLSSGSIISHHVNAKQSEPSFDRD